MKIALDGIWNLEIGDGAVYAVTLPGTLDENGIGREDHGTGRFTRRHTWEGEARFSRRLDGSLWQTVREELAAGKRIFLDAERARVLRLLADGQEIADFAEPSISTRHVFEMTDVLREGSELTLLSDNHYPGLPREAIVYASAATDETQTNWNGILGEFCLRTERQTFADRIRVYPQGDRLTVKLELCAGRAYRGAVRIDCAALRESAEMEIALGEDEPGRPATDSCQGGKAGQETAREAGPGQPATDSCQGGKAGQEAAREAEPGRPVDGFRSEKAWQEAAQQQEMDSPADKWCGEELGQKAMRWQEAAHSADERCRRAPASRRSFRQELVFRDLPLRADVKRWDLGEGSLYKLTVSLTGGETKTVTFGIREFGADESGRLTLNGRRFFLRGEANCAVFPETGYPPMTAEEWLDILAKYRSYGVNCMRFHSHCPPEAAFEAADRTGMLMQPELSHWDPKHAFESEESFRYYRTELAQILDMLANHPSFVMMTFGNELCSGETGQEWALQLLKQAHETDPTRLFAIASNWEYGQKRWDAENDFYTSSNFHQWNLRGTFAGMGGYINHRYPSAATDYEEEMARLRQEYAGPVYSFEVGQFEILPDFGELEEFHGVTEPSNLLDVKKRMEEKGLAGVWKRYVEATGELSLLGYREEAEAVMRTGSMSGISLLGIQDFPGQGTALVGMMDSHLRPKPYDFARPERFRSFFADRLPLVLLPKYTWESRETLRAGVRVANYGRESIEDEVDYVLTQMDGDAGDGAAAGIGKTSGSAAACTGKTAAVCTGENAAGCAGESTAVCTGENAAACTGEDTEHPAAPQTGTATEMPAAQAGNEKKLAAQVRTGGRDAGAGGQPAVRRRTLVRGRLPRVSCPPGCLTDAGTIEMDFSRLSWERPVRLELTVKIGGLTNHYPLWVYPPVTPVCPEEVYEARYLDEKAKAVLAAGGRVYLSPPSTKEALPDSIRAQFTTDFWSVGTFSGQEGGMGQLIDDRHPLFRRFPTEFHTNWQWWPMANRRAAILPDRCEAIVTELDSYAYLRPMVQMLECRCGNGTLLFSTLGLQDLQQFPEARALLDAVYRYMASEEFAPEQELKEELLERLVRPAD